MMANAFGKKILRMSPWGLNFYDISVFKFVSRNRRSTPWKQQLVSISVFHKIHFFEIKHLRKYFAVDRLIAN